MTWNMRKRLSRTVAIFAHPFAKRKKRGEHLIALLAPAHKQQEGGRHARSPFMLLGSKCGPQLCKCSCLCISHQVDPYSITACAKGRAGPIVSLMGVHSFRLQGHKPHISAIICTLVGVHECVKVLICPYSSHESACGNVLLDGRLHADAHRGATELCAPPPFK